MLTMMMRTCVHTHTHTEGTGGEGVKSDDEYDYALPYFEPSSKEEELVVQISDLKVPTISSSSVK